MDSVADIVQVIGLRLQIKLTILQDPICGWNPNFYPPPIRAPKEEFPSHPLPIPPGHDKIGRYPVLPPYNTDVYRNYIARDLSFLPAF